MDTEVKTWLAEIGRRGGKKSRRTRGLASGLQTAPLAVPLTDFQVDLAGCLAKNRTADSYLAGGAALLIEPNTARYSNDLDYLHDSSWRFMPTVRHERFGFVLHPVDLAINKVLALAGRDEPRDLLDTVRQDREVLCLGALCWAACGKDPGYTPLSLLDLLRRRGRLRPEDIDRLNLAAPIDLQKLKGEWLDALDSVQPFAASRPAEEIGCLYFSPSRDAFVDPRQAPDAVPHFGRPGGVLPLVAGH